jgi:hypothetical protein
MKNGIAVRWDNLFPIVGDYDGFDDIKEIVGGVLEQMPYPSQLNRPKLAVLVDGNGVFRPQPYNRWGVVGNFVIVKHSRDGRFLGMSDSECEKVIYDLRDSRGYLDPECKTLNPFREVFERYGEPPRGFVPAAGRWFR